MARRAPSASDSNLAQTICGWISGRYVAWEEKPQSAQPLADVGEEPGLGLLAVGNDVQPGRTLPGDHVGDGLAFGLGPFGPIDRLPGGGRPHQVEQRGRPGQAAHVRGLHAIGAVLRD